MDSAQVGDSFPHDINKNLLMAFSWQIGWPSQSKMVMHMSDLSLYSKQLI